MFRNMRSLARSLTLFALARVLRDYPRYKRASSPIRADEFIVREVVGPGIRGRAPPSAAREAQRLNPFFASLLYVARAGSYDENRRTWVCLYRRRRTIYQVTYPLRHVN